MTPRGWSTGTKGRTQDARLEPIMRENPVALASSLTRRRGCFTYLDMPSTRHEPCAHPLTSRQRRASSRGSTRKEVCDGRVFLSLSSLSIPGLPCYVPRPKSCRLRIYALSKRPKCAVNFDVGGTHCLVSAHRPIMVLIRLMSTRGFARPLPAPRPRPEASSARRRSPVPTKSGN